MQRKAFTLIELLVVIAIIAILAAILFPVFAQAKLAAKKVVSLSNSKQQGLAVLMYNNDNDDTFSFAQPGGWQWTESWIVNVQPYIKSLQILLAPTDSNPRYDWSGPPYSYPGNGSVCWGNGSQGDWWVHGIFNARQSWWDNYTESVNATSVGIPSETIMMGERNSLQSYGVPELTGAWDLNYVAFEGWNGDLPGQTASTLWVPPINSVGSLAVPYSGLSTFTFTDGHSKSLIPMATINASASSNETCGDGTSSGPNAGYLKFWDAARTQ